MVGNSKPTQNRCVKLIPFTFLSLKLSFQQNYAHVQIEIQKESLASKTGFFNLQNFFLQAYVTWFSISNFFVPLIVLIFTHASICVTIWKTLGKSNAAPRITINLPSIQVNLNWIGIALVTLVQKRSSYFHKAFDS